MLFRCLAICLLFSFALCWFGDDDDTDLASKLKSFPNKFTLTNNIISLHHRISIESEDGVDIGSFKKRIVSAHDVYVLEDKHGNNLATATKSFISIGSEFTIESDYDDHMYTINEEWIESALRLGDIYTISQDDREIASMQKTDYVRDEIHVNCGGHLCATMKKAWFGIRDSWSVDVVPSSELEPWVAGFFTAISQISADKNDDDDDDDNNGRAEL